jgi:hypothetical protein
VPKSSSLSLEAALKLSNRTLAITIAEVYWLRMLFCEIKFSLSTTPTIWCDNLSALALASNLVYHARTKHIEIDYHFVREKVLNHDILLKFISAHDQLAYLFTKGLSSARFSFLRSKLMVVPPPISLRGVVREHSSNPSHEDTAHSSYKSKIVPVAENHTATHKSAPATAQSAAILQSSQPIQ